MKLEELYSILDQKEQFILAIDGRCGSGKSTIAAQLAQKYHANVFHMDDFYLPMNLRNEKRFAEIGGNVHYERLIEEVLIPLQQEKDIYYRGFDHQKMDVAENGVLIPYRKFNIIEGSYALRDDLLPYYTDMIVIDLPLEERLRRIEKRNPNRYQMFVDVWIPLEEKYFEGKQIYQRFDCLQLD